jgi:microcin C transport system substrate-binding protein
MRRCGLHVLLSCLVLVYAPMSLAAHALALYGEVKYKQGFQHFDYVNPTAPKGGQFKLSSTASFDSTNPFIIKGIAAPGISNFIYQSLMTPSYDEPQSFYGLIAESVDVASDGGSVTFTLNEKAKWHDGKPITAADVVWSLEILKEKGHPQYRALYKPISKAVAIDARHVRFEFAEKHQRELLIIVASMPVLPMHWFCGDEESKASPLAGEVGGGANHLDPALSDTPLPNPPRKGEGTTERVTASCQPFDKTSLDIPLGSGAYKVEKIDAGRSITYSRDKNYWAANLPSQRGLNNFDTITVDVYRDDVVALQAIKSGAIDFYEEFIARNWATAYDSPAVADGRLQKINLPHKIPRGMQGFIFNTRRDKFSDRRVREAINLTLDFEWMNGTLFYNAYSRNRSFFEKTEFEATDVPKGDELKLLQSWRCSPSPQRNSLPIRGRVRVGASGGTDSATGVPLPTSPLQGEELPATCLPSSLFTTPYVVGQTDGSGFSRERLIRAQQLLNDAGWVMKDGHRVNAKTGEKLSIEFLMTQRTFERVIGIMRRNLSKLGIASEFRYVDASQYQKRLDKFNFDIVSMWINQGLFYPGAEQTLLWHSSQADVTGGQNLGGVKSAVIDDLTTRIRSAKTLAELRPAARALDRVLLAEHYVIPHWSIHNWRIAYWNKFGRPPITPAYNVAWDSWWIKSGSGDSVLGIGEENPSTFSLKPKTQNPTPVRSAP